MASKRLARLNEQLKRELAELIQTELRDPRIGMVSVTAVQIASDLGSARVFIRALGGEAERAESLEGLVAAAPYLRTSGRTRSRRSSSPATEFTRALAW